MEKYDEINSLSEQNFKQYFSTMPFLSEKVPLLTCPSRTLRASYQNYKYAATMIAKCLCNMTIN